MPETLTLKFSAGDEQVDWVIIDDAGTTTSAGRGELAELVAAADQRRVIVVVPAISVLRVAVAIPLKGAAKIRQALPFALEEQIAGKIEDQHFAFRKADAAGLTPVAVVADALMEAWLKRLLENGIRADAIYCESDGIPALPATISILVDGNNSIIRDASGEFTVTDSTSMPVILEMLLDQHAEAMENDATAVPANVLCYCDERTHRSYEELWSRLRMHTDSVESRIIADGALPFMAGQLARNEGINLLQGDYAAKADLNIDWEPWKLPGAMLAAFLLVVLVFQGASFWQLSRTEASLDAAAAQVLATTFPDAAGTADPWRALESRLGSRSAGGTGSIAIGPGFAEAISVLTEAAKEVPELKMQTIGFRSGILDLQLRAPSVDALDQLRQKISDSGVFEASIQSANPSDDYIKGRMQIIATES